ncbi:MAG: acylneuraminate cytidylyltransferase family protein [Fulvivirga sp.]|uniref:acylneuraminate cytidylyltransferase family protein n=1 Tax=Fulvivirga sp. TaxID=1931237 RepID=UPI0032EFAC20
MQNILVTLCARGGSKGIPGKNIKILAGKPLIVYSINHAREFISKFGGEIILSTDSKQIIEVASAYALTSDYTRPTSLATDLVGKIEVIQDVLRYAERTRQKKYDYILDLDITSPLRNINDLTEAFKLITSNHDATNIFSVNSANRNPYFNMVELKNDGYAKLVKEGNFLTRQSAPKVYDMNASFYIYRRKFFDQDNKSVITNASLIYVMKHTCFDLDEPQDFEIMNYLLSNDRLDFAL